MTMIRINLIAEKKAGAPKAVKKTTRGQSEVQEYLVLIVCALAAAGVFFFLKNRVETEYNNQLALETKLKQDYEKVKHWKEQKENMEIQKELLNEKIQKISDLKDRREGPVKLMEDVANVLPESVWLGGIEQGYNANLIQPTGAGRTALKPTGRNLGEPNLIKISGYAKTTEAITSFARKFIDLEMRYFEHDLNNIVRDPDSSLYSFELYFKVLGKTGAEGAAKPQQGGAL